MSQKVDDILADLSRELEDAYSAPLPTRHVIRSSSQTGSDTRPKPGAPVGISGSSLTSAAASHPFHPHAPSVRSSVSKPVAVPATVSANQLRSASSGYSSTTTTTTEAAAAASTTSSRPFAPSVPSSGSPFGSYSSFVAVARPPTTSSTTPKPQGGRFDDDDDDEEVNAILSKLAPSKPFAPATPTTHAQSIGTGLSISGAGASASGESRPFAPGAGRTAGTVSASVPSGPGAPTTSSSSVPAGLRTGAFMGLGCACAPLLLLPIAANDPQLPGSSVSSTMRPCPHMRCTQCDHPVIRIPRRVWDANKVDYYFFRNNVPDLQKLEAGTIATPADSPGAAYCCQCAWRSVRVVENLTEARRIGARAVAAASSTSASALRSSPSGSPSSSGSIDSDADIWTNERAAGLRAPAAAAAGAGSGGLIIGDSYDRLQEAEPWQLRWVCLNRGS